MNSVAIVRIGTNAQISRGRGGACAPRSSCVFGQILHQPPDWILAWNRQAVTNIVFARAKHCGIGSGLRTNVSGTYINDFRAAFQNSFLPSLKTPID